MESRFLTHSGDDPPIVLRLAHSQEMQNWRSLMRQHHYLGFERIVGEALFYVAQQGQKWLALLGWGSAALKCAPRDQWIGWLPAFKWPRLRLIANNARFLILPGCHQANLASHILALNLKRLSQDWQHFHGHPIYLAETFVDTSRFRGTCYRAAGWQVLGKTLGYSKSNRSYWQNGQPKLVLVHPVVKNARRRLTAPFLPAFTSQRKESLWMMDVNRLPLQEHGGLIDLLKKVVDPRKPRGVRHPVSTVVAIAVCAALSGARSFCAIAEWAQILSPEALRKLGSKRPRPPSEPTIRRVLQRIDADRLDAQIGRWLLDQYPMAGRALAVDGKTLRGGHDLGRKAPHLLSAILHQEAVVIGQIGVDEKTNEIPKLPQLLQPMALQGAVVTADALHTQKETARYLVEEKQADYLFIAKDNQPGLRTEIAALNLEATPPGALQHR
jgi:hypothetical protein